MSDDDRTVMAEGKYLRLVRRGRWEFVERTNISGIVLIIAVTGDDRIVLTEQFRVPVGAPVIELPAGLAGDTADFQGEALVTAARRELLEETGYESEGMMHLVDTPTSAGAMNESVSFFLAEGLRKTGPGGGDDSEKIAVHEVQLSRIDEFLNDCLTRGLQVDAKVYSGLYLLATRR